MHPKVRAIFACEGAPPAARVTPPALEVVAALGGGHTTDRSGGEGGGGGGGGGAVRDRCSRRGHPWRDSSSFEALATSHAEVGCSGSGGAVTHADAGQEGGGVTRQDDDTNAPPGRSPTGGPDRRADRRHDGDDVGAVGVQGVQGGGASASAALGGGARHDNDADAPPGRPPTGGADGRADERRMTNDMTRHPRAGLRLGVPMSDIAAHSWRCRLR